MAIVVGLIFDAYPATLAARCFNPRRTAGSHFHTKTIGLPCRDHSCVER